MNNPRSKLRSYQFAAIAFGVAGILWCVGALIGKNENADMYVTIGMMFICISMMFTSLRRRADGGGTR